MKIRLIASLLLLACAQHAGAAQSATQAAPPTPPAPPAITATPPVPPPAAASARAGDDADDDDDADDRPVQVRLRRQGNAVVSVGRDAELAAGREADAVVAIGGNALSAGTVRDGVVAVDGNARATGPVGQGVVAVLGDAYVNSSARSVVAVFGNVELGPEARVSREVVAVGGIVRRDPAAQVSGREQVVSIGHLGTLDGLRTWLKRCALLGRPLAFDARLGWAWGIALGFVALYALLALLFRDAIARCVHTFETWPGRSLLAALLSIALTPVLFVLLLVTVIGVVLLPFLGVALMAATLFGKAVMLVWIGRRVYRDERPLVPLLIGAAFVLLLYVVPVLGFVVYKLLGLVGLGVVLYTLLLAIRPAPAGAAAAPAAASTTGADAGAEALAAKAAEASPSPGVAPEAGPTAAAGPPPAAGIAPPIDFTSLPRAGFWPRMAALAVDAMMILVVTQLVSHAGARAVLALLAIYAAILWRHKGTTVGGSVFGLKVVRTDGRPLDWTTSIVRALGCLLSLAIAGLGFLWIAIDHDSQAWHDRIAGTAVVRVPKGVSLL